MPWLVERQFVITRGSLERGTSPTFGWEVDPHLAGNGTFATAPDAMRAALAASNGPGWLTISDKLVRWEWRRPYNHARRRRLVRTRAA